MVCRNCGIEIADKAIVCYRCGTATTDPVRKPVEVRRRRGLLVPIVVLLVLAALALFLGYEYHVFGLQLIVPSTSDSVHSSYSVCSVYAVADLIDFHAIHA